MTLRSGSSSSRLSAALRRSQAASSGQSPPVPSAAAMFEWPASTRRWRIRYDPASRPSTVSRHRAVEARVTVGLRLVDRAVPERDRHPAVGIPRRPRLDEAAGAVAVDRRATAPARRAVRGSGSPRIAACGGCRSSAARTRRGRVARARRARRSGRRRPSTRATRAGRQPSASRGRRAAPPRRCR